MSDKPEALIDSIEEIMNNLSAVKGEAFSRSVHFCFMVAQQSRVIAMLTADTEERELKDMLVVLTGAMLRDYADAVGLDHKDVKEVTAFTDRLMDRLIQAEKDLKS